MKKLLSILLALAMLLSLAACAADEPAPTDPPQNTGGEPTETTPPVAGNNDQNKETVVIDLWVATGGDNEYYETMIKKFNDENEDGIYVNLTIGTGFDDMMQMAYDGGTAPDIWHANGFNVANFIETGMLYPLDEFIQNDSEYQKVNDPYNHAYEGKNLVDGKLYFCYSGIRSGVRVIYNKDLLAKSGYTEIPDNLPEFEAMLKKITEDGDGEYYGIGFTSSSPIGRLFEPIAQMSGLTNYDYKTGKFDFSALRPVLEYCERIIAEGYAYPDYQGVDNMRALFAEGQFAVWANASQEAGVFTQQIPITDFEWGVAEVPTLTGEVKGALAMTPQCGYSMLSSCENKEAAWKVISFLQSEEFLKGWLEGGFGLPITEYMDAIIDKSGVGKMAEFSLQPYESLYPAVIGTFSLTGDNWHKVLWDAVNGYITLDEAFADLNARYNECLDAAVEAGTTKRVVIPEYDPMNPSSGITYQSE